MGLPLLRVSKSGALCIWETTGGFLQRKSFQLWMQDALLPARDTALSAVLVTDLGVAF